MHGQVFLKLGGNIAWGGYLQMVQVQQNGDPSIMLHKSQEVGLPQVQEFIL